MTVTVQLPYNNLVGNGATTIFAFTFGLTEEQDLWVLVDGELQAQSGDYLVQNVDDDGGEVVFDEAPADGVSVIIFRDTTRSQEIDYVEGEPFPAVVHEGGFDKFMRILQELITSTFNGIDVTGAVLFSTFDLDVSLDEINITITNTGGTDAVIPPWEDATFAGGYHGTLDVEANLPDDEDATTKPDGYVWLGY